MRRRHYSFDHRDRVEKTGERSRNNHPEINRVRSKKKNRRYGRYIISALALILIGLGVYLGSSLLTSANSMLSSDVTIKDIFSKSSLKQTDGRTNILILGKGGSNHPGGQLTDTILLASIKNSDKKVAFVSIPRDLMVSIPGSGFKKINEAYTTGWNSIKDENKKGEEGAKSASEVVSKVTGVPIHYFFTLDFVGFKSLVDTLGGITVNVEKDLSDPLYPQDYFGKDGSYTKTDAYSPFYLKAGKQDLDGVTALKYARSRETTSDFDRAKRQQNLLLAIKDKALSLGVLANPKKLTDIMSDLGNHIKTSLTVAEIKSLIEIVKNVDKTTITNKVLDNGPAGLLVSSSEGFYHLEPKAGATNYKEIQALVKNIFSTETSTELEITDVEVLNGAGTAGLGGKVADKLKAEGLNVVKIDTNPTEIEKTTIFSSKKTGTTIDKIKSVVGVSTVELSNDKEVIRVVIGKNYGE